MTRGGRDPPKRSRRKVGTNPIRVQPARRCKVSGWMQIRGEPSQPELTAALAKASNVRETGVRLTRSAPQRSTRRGLPAAKGTEISSSDRLSHKGSEPTGRVPRRVVKTKAAGISGQTQTASPSSKRVPSQSVKPPGNQRRKPRSLNNLSSIGGPTTTEQDSVSDDKVSQKRPDRRLIKTSAVEAVPILQVTGSHPDFVFTDPENEPPPPLPEGHKLVHIVRHCRAWHNLVARGSENLAQIHDPGLTPGGHSDARLFAERYPHLQNPQIILTSHLRRCLQMSLEIKSYLDEARPDLGSIRIMAHPDLQEVSTHPCDTGTPLNVLRNEFPNIDFPDALFPEAYPRSEETEPSKRDTVFDDVPDLLDARGRRVREFIKTNLDETEIIVVTHGTFLHFLLNWWTGEPGKSRPYSIQQEFGEAKPFTIPGKSLPGLEFERLVYYSGPIYPMKHKLQDFSDEISLCGIRDCGIFTPERIRKA